MARTRCSSGRNNRRTRNASAWKASLRPDGGDPRCELLEPWNPPQQFSISRTILVITTIVKRHISALELSFRAPAQVVQRAVTICRALIVGVSADSPLGVHWRRT